ncbi:MAG: iron-sulfur protein, partial [Actinobacteria bacterium]|nr:iron-sulfur protein [Actinomycetota bacterium]
MGASRLTFRMERKRIKGPHLVLVIGLAFAIVTALSGVAATVFQQHDESPTTREVFGGIPSSLKIAFYVMVSILLVYGAVLFSQRVKNWTRGKPDNRRTTSKNVKRRLGDFRAGVYMQTLLRDPAAGIMHSLIYFSFLILLAVTTILEINHQIPESWKFLNGNVYMAYSFIGDLAGLCLFIGVMWAIVRRYIQRPYRIRIKTKPEHAVILGVFLAITVTGFGTEAWRIAETGMPAFEKWSFVSWPIANLIKDNSNLAGGHQVWWILHIFSFFAFLVILPVTMLRHMFTSPL